MALYTKEEYERAKEYVKARIGAVNDVSDAVEFLVADYAERIAEMLYDGASQSDIDAVIEDLIDEIFEMCLTYAVGEHVRNRDLIIAFITAKMEDGKTLRDRIRERCLTLLNEIAVLVAAGIIIKAGYTAIINSIRKYLKNPFDNPIIADAREKIGKGEVSTDVDLSTPHFGQGVAISSLTALDTITEYAVGMGWIFNEWRDASDNGAIGFIPFRGSSYPCDECDSHAGKFHKMSDDAPLYHPHCMCWLVYIYNKEDE